MINLQSKEFEEARLNTFSELPDSTRGVGKNSRYICVTNPMLSWWHVNEDEVIKEFEDYIPLYIAVNSLENRKVEFSYHRVVQEICIYIDGKWSGYFDSYEIENVLVKAREMGIVGAWGKAPTLSYF
ncbi:hypothetical protein [Vibrio sp. D431a]|uniref:hypothetical protein n=1 Tax=Vibrio sp. D431a TaxID=2837388 RepID=UPI0025544624|nr:hypothetical protein [Vibrio sp. D431a]MDK9793748.1 hypothetical protein [Vibrio sp. D431a]